MGKLAREPDARAAVETELAESEETTPVAVIILIGERWTGRDLPRSV